MLYTTENDKQLKIVSEMATTLTAYNITTNTNTVAVNANVRVHLTSAQTITAQHIFSNGVK